MPSPTHLYEILIKAPVADVWTAITDPTYTRRYFHHTAFESSLEPGSAMRYVLPNGDGAVDGTIEIIEPEERLVMTWHVLYDADLAVEPPSRVEWRVASASDDGGITRVVLRHYDLGMSPRTSTNVRGGWYSVIDGMKTLLETGQELGDVVHDEPAVADVVQSDHRALAIAANNAAWELLDGRDLTADDGDDLLGRVYAAAYHWRRATEAASIQSARAAFMCAHAHAVLGQGEIAVDRALRCRALTDAAGDAAADFDHGYAILAEARALACAGSNERARVLRSQARQLTIANDEDRAIFVADLAAGPWYQLDDGPT